MGQVYFLLSLYVPRRSAVCHLGAQTDGGGTIRDKVCFHRPSAAAAAVATNWGVTRGPCVHIHVARPVSRSPCGGAETLRGARGVP